MLTKLLLPVSRCQTALSGLYRICVRNYPLVPAWTGLILTEPRGVGDLTTSVTVTAGCSFWWRERYI